MHTPFVVTAVIPNPDDQVWEVMVPALAADETELGDEDNIEEMIDKGEE